MGLGFYGIAGAMMKGAQDGADRVDARKDKEAQRARQAEQDAMRKQEFEARMKEVTYQEGLRNAAQGIESARLEVMKNKGTETSQVPVIQHEGKTYEAPSLDPAALPKDAGVTGGRGVVVKGLDGVQQAFGTAAEADVYKDKLTPSAYSIQKKLQERFSQMPGGEAAAAAAAQRAQVMQKEGMFDALRFLSAGQPEQAIKAFESVGNERIPPGAKFVAQQGKDPITGAAKSIYTMVGSDGKVIIPNLHEAVYGYVLEPAKRLELEFKQADDLRGERDFALREKVANASIAAQKASAGRANKADDPLRGFNNAKAVFRAAWGREPTQEEAIKLAGLAGDSYEKSDAAFAADIVKAGVTAGSVDPAKAPVVRQDIINAASAARKQAPVSQPKTKAEYDALPKGSQYRHIDGTLKIKG